MTISDDLKLFWDDWIKKNTVKEKIELLQLYAEHFYKVRCRTSRQAKRRKSMRIKIKYKNTSCKVCGKLPTIIHHIIMLIYGGNNSSKNIISLCNSCHGKIHPWLNHKSISSILGNLDKEYLSIVKI